MREHGSYKNIEEYLMFVEGDKNAVCPILFKDFEYGPFTMNKSYLIKEADILAASKDKRPNSISMIGAIKLRWEICHPKDQKWDTKRCNKPLREFVQEIGLELYLDMSEVIDVRMPIK